MVKKHYLPRGFEKRARWLNNFAKEFEKIAPDLGFSNKEVESVKNDAAMFTYATKVQTIMRGTHKSFTAFKDMLNEGGTRQRQLSVPVLPELPPVPQPVAPGIFRRMGNLVARIKGRREYTDAIGVRLGVIGAEQKIDISKAKPQLKAKVAGGKLIISWNKSVFTGINLSINCNDEKGFSKGRFYSKTPVKLNMNLPPGQRTALWQLMAYYQIWDDIVGQPSSIVEVIVSN